MTGGENGGGGESGGKSEGKGGGGSESGDENGGGGESGDESGGEKRGGGKLEVDVKVKVEAVKSVLDVVLTCANDML
ncbi:hypothetical protein M8J77_004970 [Diaphorina citri]|nr:hypothetical protein M8J77_004970 [Diaphorina citri]